MQQTKDAALVITVAEAWLAIDTDDHDVEIPEGGVKEMEGARDGIIVIVYDKDNPPQILGAMYDRSGEFPVIEDWDDALQSPIGGKILDQWNEYKKNQSN